ncbi:MAG: high-potential iron-sulfur domain protein [Pseudomonadota bacterium]|jgi:hypothetical protein
MNNRRAFLTTTACTLAGISVVVADNVNAQAMVGEAEPQAAALGYKADTTKVDQKKFPKHSASQRCDNCVLYQSKSATGGACAIFAGKLVPPAAWCSAYQKKA